MVVSTISRRSSKEPHASRLYRELVPAYGAVWPMLARRRIRAAIDNLHIHPGDKVLEVGVGTGMSFTAYPAGADITGVDLSEEMLSLAQRQIEEEGWNNIRVMRMNAQELEFEDSSFDVVTSFHVISVVSDPRQMMREAIRVCKPGGRLLIVNHFRSNNPWIARMVDSAGAVTRHLGWRTDLDLEEIVAELPLRVERRYKTSPTSLFTILTATKTGTPAPASHRAIVSAV
jgi:phosphatidylethanolamine/phosphatidyl-N-methylethanolamine N-methyltransferase